MPQGLLLVEWTMCCELVVIRRRKGSKIPHRKREEKRKERKGEMGKGGRLSTTLETSPESILLLQPFVEMGERHGLCQPET
jgi:hypothetical protein